LVELHNKWSDSLIAAFKARTVDVMKTVMPLRGSGGMIKVASRATKISRVLPLKQATNTEELHDNLQCLVIFDWIFGY
jgi:hypothetical protein